MLPRQPKAFNNIFDYQIKINMATLQEMKDAVEALKTMLTTAQDKKKLNTDSENAIKKAIDAVAESAIKNTFTSSY
jgi:hypothetical protein